MPRYFFHVDDGELMTDPTGTELPDLATARSEAVSAAGAMLAEVDGKFWNHGTPWVMHVTDTDSQLLFSLHFSAEVPSGAVAFDPAPRDS